MSMSVREATYQNQLKLNRTNDRHREQLDTMKKDFKTAQDQAIKSYESRIEAKDKNATKTRDEIVDSYETRIEDQKLVVKKKLSEIDERNQKNMRELKTFYEDEAKKQRDEFRKELGIMAKALRQQKESARMAAGELERKNMIVLERLKENSNDEKEDIVESYNEKIKLMNKEHNETVKRLKEQISASAG